MSRLLEKYSWTTGKRRRMAGTEDWIEVGQLGDSGGYDWSDFNVFYSPSARLFFWHGDSGCSCNSWEDGIDNAADFENGDRAALLRAWDSFCHAHYLSDGYKGSGITQIRAFEA